MDDDLTLVEEVDNEMAGREPGFADARGELLFRCAATITRLHAENEALKSDVSDLVRAGSDEATENERLVKERDETSGLLDAMRQRQDGLQLGDVDPAMFELMAEAMDIVAPDMGEQMSSEASGQIMCLLAMQMTGAILAVHDEWKKGAE